VGQTKRFLEKINEEEDAIVELQDILRQKSELLFSDDVEKNYQLNELILDIVKKSNHLYKLVWHEYEPKVKNENSEVLEALSNLLNLILLSKCQKWVKSN
jgi:hypothetical protein